MPLPGFDFWWYVALAKYVPSPAKPGASGYTVRTLAALSAPMPGRYGVPMFPHIIFHEPSDLSYRIGTRNTLL